MGVASGLHDASALAVTTGDLEQALQAHGGIRVAGDAAGETMPLVYFIQTGGVEENVIHRFHSRKQQGRDEPVLLVAHTGHNSLPASLEILARVRQEGGRGRIYLLRDVEDEETLDEVVRTMRCLEANRRLAEDRIGQIGEASDWLAASMQRAEVVHHRFGTRMIGVPLAELREGMGAGKGNAMAELSPEERKIWDGATAHEGVTLEGFGRAMEVYRGLKELVARYRLSALTVRCFDLVQQDGTTGCLALARLADEGISAGCEGDVPTILLLRWLWHLTGRSAWMANPSNVNVETGEVRLAHCTVPLGLVERYSFATHFESGLGVGIDGVWGRGPVTLLRLGGAELEKWWGAEGTLVEDQHEEDQCRTQVRVRLMPAAAAELLENPLGNHLVMAPGHVRRLMAEAMGWLLP